MPLCYPPQPVFASDAERDVWTQLVTDLPAHATVIANWERSERSEEYESDLIVVWPGKGIFIVEVKGGYVSEDADGRWWTSDRHGERHAIDPFHQARRTAHAIEQYVEHEWSQGKLHLPWLVAFPHTDLPSGFHTAEAARDRIIDRGELAILVDHLKDIGHDGAGSLATSIRCEAFIQAMVDVRDPQQWFMASGAVREQRVRQLTEEQREKLDEMADNPRFAIVGPAGSGKTYLALEQARIRAGNGERVAIVCYSYGLAQMLQRSVAQWPEDERPTFVGTFHYLAAVWGIIPPDPAPNEWWLEVCPARMLEEAVGLADDERFDTVIVDEGQDFLATWWQALTASMRDPEHGGMFVFGDMDQNLFDRDALRVLGLATSRLTRNMRNARPIAELAALLSSSKSRHLGVEGPAVEFQQCSSDQAQRVAEDVVEGLLHEGWAAGDIAFLTTRHKPDVRKEYEGEDAEDTVQKKAQYWSLFWDQEDVFFATVSAFKGLERRVVVLAIDGRGDHPRTRETLYTGMTRARDLLIICGDLDDMRLAGCGALAAALRS